MVFVLVGLSLLLFGCEKENKSKLNVPQNLVVETGGIVSFKRVDVAGGNEYYSIFINDLEYVLTKNNQHVEIFNFDGVNYFQFNAAHLLTLGESYQFKVQAHAKDKKSSDVSAAVSYLHCEKLATPTNVQLQNNVLTWGAVWNAEAYDVKVVMPDGQQQTFETALTSFNILQVVKEVGTYSFAVCAKSSNKIYAQSDFCVAVEHAMISQLQTPTVGQIFEDENGQFVAQLLLDERANSLILKINGQQTELDINSACLQQSGQFKNVWQINLSALGLGLNKFEFSVCANFKTSGQSYFSASNFSNVVLFEKLVKLPAPTIEIEQTEAGNFLNILDEDKTNIAGYELFVATASGVKTEKFVPEVCKIALNDYVAVALKKLGKGGYASSPLSGWQSSALEEQESFDVTLVGSTLKWAQAGFADFYVLEIGNQTVVSSANELDLLEHGLAKTIKISAIKAGKQVRTVQFDFDGIELSAPTDVKLVGQMLTFAKVENAFGYAVFVKGMGANDANFVKLNNLFSSTQIDVGEYLSGVADYEICVVAVADKGSCFANSQQSAKVELKKRHALEAPTLTSDAIVVSGQKVYLNFVGVEGAASYEILINYHPIYVLAESLQMRVDISTYAVEAGEYSFMLRALPSNDSDFLLPSSYTVSTQIIIKQLAMVDGIEVENINGEYTLKFNLVDNAFRYKISISKTGDAGYDLFLQQNGLQNPFQVNGICNITNYINSAGEYSIVITAMANNNGYYVNATESEVYKFSVKA